MFYVVQLDSETLNEKIVVPSLWLDKYNTHCLLPPFTTAADVESLAKSRASPKHGWQMYSVKFIQSFDTYSQAAESVESSKNRPLMIELEEEEEGHQIEGNDKRKRKRPPFLENYSTETDDEEHGGTTKDDRSIEEIINHIDPCIVKLETMDGVVPLEFYRQQDIDAARNKRPSNCTVLNENPSQLGESSSSSVRPANELLNMKCPCNSSCHRMFFQSFAAMRRQIEDSNRMLYQILGHLTVPPPNLNALAGSPIGFPVTLPIRELSELHSLNTYLSNQGNFTEAIPFFTGLGGNYPRQVLKRIMEVLVSRELSVKLNWKGRGDKDPFHIYNKIHSFVLNVARQSSCAKNISLTDVESFLKDWLKYASLRVPRNPKKSSNQDERVLMC